MRETDTDGSGVINQACFLLFPNCHTATRQHPMTVTSTRNAHSNPHDDEDDTDGGTVPVAPSKLGTRQHWDEVYEREVRNFDDHGDIGEVWFGEDTVMKMMDWILDNIEDKDLKTIDLGCGNGHMLLEMHDNGFTNLIGVDYSGPSIELAQRIAAAKAAETTSSDDDTGENSDIPPLPRYFQFDLLAHDGDARGSPDTVPADVAAIEGPFGFAVDKGTFDAISLSAEHRQEEEMAGDSKATVQQSTSSTKPAVAPPPLAARYARGVSRLLQENGILLITSCNWTEAELVAGFQEDFSFFGRVKYRTFSFGGRQGQTVVTVAFRKRRQGDSSVAN
ncbi:S-adenosyl-L-methionine-dependent methyltransferase [Zopfochytrium polystomum]|nr:S-adenosyl-L-methionine-dependent methyltransferase [Zopfochytrium polystomum]